MKTKQPIKYKYTEKFTLQHVVLYAKNWYERSENLIEDLKVCLSADNYSGEVFRKDDVARVLLLQFERLSKRKVSLFDFINHVNRHECWKVGYYTKDHTWVDTTKLPEYDLEMASIYYCLSTFAYIEATEWKATTPNYKKCLPRPKRITDEKLIQFNSYIQNNS